MLEKNDLTILSTNLIKIIIISTFILVKIVIYQICNILYVFVESI